jgi:Ca-activated chloride channel homolog
MRRSTPTIRRNENWLSGNVRLRIAARPDRRGAVLVLIAMSSILLLAMLGFTVDVSYMQLIRTELRIATDASAKAGAEALRRTQNPDAAVQAALDVAAQNSVAGKPLVLNSNDVVLGRCVMQPDGTYAFSAGVQPYNGVQISSHLDANSKNGPAKLMFGTALGVNTFQPKQQATAGQTVQEIALVIDRSHSMCFDLSGVEWEYPRGVKSPPYDQPPHSKLSRWAALTNAVKSFTSIIGQQKTPPRVGLITWASDMQTKPPFPATAIDSQLTSSMSNITTPIATRGSKIMWGGTNMSGGIDAGVKMLTAGNVNPLADKVMILMTDGQWNDGRDPILAAQDAKKSKVIIHTVCLLAGASESVCQQIAQITGGTYTYAGNAAELTAAFEKLARQLAVTLIE